MTDIIQKSTDGFEMSKFDGEAGQIVAYISTFGNIDKVGDVMAPEAFDKFVNDFEKVQGNKLPMLLQHSNTKIVGEWSKFEINSRGIKGFGTIYTEIPDGQNARGLVMRGMIGSTSIGFRSNKFEKLDGDGRLFKEVELVETSLVINPANSKAKILSAKREDGSVDLKIVGEILRNADLSHSETKALIADGQKALRNVGADERAKQELVDNLMKQLGGSFL